MDAIMQFINKNLVVCIVVLSALTAVVCFFLIRAIVKLGKEAKKSAPSKPKVKDGYDELFSKPFWNEDGDNASVTAHEQVEKEPVLSKRQEKLLAKQKQKVAKQQAIAQTQTKKTAQLGEEGFRPIMRNIEEPSATYNEPQDNDYSDTQDSYDNNQEEQYNNNTLDDSDNQVSIQPTTTEPEDNYSAPDTDNSTQDIDPMPQLQSAQATKESSNSQSIATKPKFKIVKLASGGFRFKLEGDKVYMVSGTYADIPTTTNIINNMASAIAVQDFSFVKSTTGIKYVFKLDNSIVANSSNFTDEKACKEEAKLVRWLLLN